MRRIALLSPPLLLLALTLAATAPGAQARAAACRVPNVVGLSAQAARAAFHAAGCTGTVFRTTSCIAAKSKFVPFIGKVRSQTPAAGTNVAAKKAVEITVGVVCDKGTTLKPPKQSTGGYASLDGSWTATFTVQQSSNPIAQQGQKLTGIAFTVKNGQLGGGLNGTISSTGRPSPDVPGITLYDANVTSTMLGIACQGTVSFWVYDNAGQAASEAGITCGGGQSQVVGDFRATQNP